jgi:hypothetical protein
MFQVPNVLEDSGVTGDSSPATAIETTDGLLSSREEVARVSSTMVVSVVVVLVDLEGGKFTEPA